MCIVCLSRCCLSWLCEGLPGGEEGGVAVGEEAVVVGEGLVVHF